MVYDILGIGFGPAALSLAVSMEDEFRERPNDLRIKFIEKLPAFSWHNNFLLPGTTINHHYFRDLATPRDPTSRFTFAYYLKEKGRLFEFGHLGGSPTRVEWNDYLCWAAAQLDSYVEYNTMAHAVHWNDEKSCLQVTTSKGDFYAKNLVVAVGLKPRIPSIYHSFMSSTLFHSSKFLESIARNENLKYGKRKFLVVGSGQSAAEALIYLRNNFSGAEIFSTHKAVGFKIKESGHLSNVIYFPEETNFFYGLPPEKKPEVLRDTTSADYGNISYDTSRQLFHIMYEDKVVGHERIHMKNRMQVTEISKAGERYRVKLQHLYNEEAEIHDFDIVVLCTGYLEQKYPSILNEMRPLLLEDESDSLHLSREYKLKHYSDHDISIYLCGGSERTHGISDTQTFSLMAIKGEVILKDILKTVPEMVCK